MVHFWKTSRSSFSTTRRSYPERFLPLNTADRYFDIWLPDLANPRGISVIWQGLGAYGGVLKQTVYRSFSTTRRSFYERLMPLNIADSYLFIWQPDLAKFHVEIRILARMTAMFELIFIHADRHIIRIVNGRVMRISTRRIVKFANDTVSNHKMVGISTTQCEST